MLAGSPLDPKLELGSARPIWMRFETEAPVDDILVATSAGGFVAIQAKTTVNSSRDRASPLGKAVDQFVRHWLACRNGDGSLEWNRPLNLELDRLVLAVGPKSSAAIRHHLPLALQASWQHGSAVLTKEQKTVLDSFESLVCESWEATTKEILDRDIIENIFKLTSILTVDDDAISNVANNTTDEFGLGLTPYHVLKQFCGELMAKRGGFDVSTLRQGLATRGVKLGYQTNYKSDIEKLKAHTALINRALGRYEVIKLGDGSGSTFGITRECQKEIEKAAQQGSLLIVGEPGAGKSGVLNALATSLRENGNDVIELAVDSYSVETLEGLANELQLEHSLLDVLEAWDGPEPAWLIVDALDATRGGKGEGVFRALIDSVVSRNGRWKVVASIRTFDLRMGRKFRELFRGVPPAPGLADPDFSSVRHIRIPPWTAKEFSDLLERAPKIEKMLASSSARLRDLATVPFNTRLIGELLDSEDGASDFVGAATQAELLNVYWDFRVKAHGYAVEACVRNVVAAMVSARALRASRLEVAQIYPDALEILVSEGVLVSSGGDRWLQFRHHLLFDYAASRVYLDSDALLAESSSLDRSAGIGLMLAPALSFVLTELWTSEIERKKFWRLVTTLLSDDGCDPVVRSVASRMPVELAEVAGDVEQLAALVLAGDAPANAALQHVVGSLAVGIDEGLAISFEPWTNLAKLISPAIKNVVWPMRLLCFLLVGKEVNSNQRNALGVASRALLEHSLGMEDQSLVAPAAIGFVAETYETDLAYSRRLLTRIFEESNFVAYGSENVPALAQKVKEIWKSDPEFVRIIYREVYSKDVEADRVTHLGKSQILPLRSNAKQDYDLARYSLSEFFPDFIRLSPKVATRALIDAVDGYLARKHSFVEENQEFAISISGKTVRLIEDHSHIWAHDPESKYAEDGEVLITLFLKYLRDADEASAANVASEIIESAGYAIYWSRLFMAAVERNDSLVDILWPIASSEVFLVTPDTRKDAVDLVTAGYSRRSSEERAKFEESVDRFDFSDFDTPESAKDALLERLFRTIGQESLVTSRARKIVAEDTIENGSDNGRLFSVRSHSSSPEPYFWLENFDATTPENAALSYAIEAVKDTVGFGRNNSKSNSDLTEKLGSLRSLSAALLSQGAHTGLREYAEGIIAEGVGKILSDGEVPTTFDLMQANYLTELIEAAASSNAPVVSEKTEESFAESASWGSPAPRVEAAQAALDMLWYHPDLYQRLLPTIDRLLADAHPAVRLQSAGRLIRLWDIDREGFWNRLDERISIESNASVIDGLVSNVMGRVYNNDPVRAEDIVIRLLGRLDGETKWSRRNRRHAAQLVAHIWVGHSRERARKLILDWTANVYSHRNELRAILATLRNAYVYGLYGETRGEDHEIRLRAQGVVRECVASCIRLLADSRFPDPASEERIDERRGVLELVDAACMELYFSAESLEKKASGDGELENKDLQVFFQEMRDVLKEIGTVGAPHTIYYLLQLLENFVASEPGVTFDLASNALLKGGVQNGYHYESMGADLLVKMIGVFLADHKEIFENEERRRTLIDCLEVFMKAGWPSARRLLYHLPDLVQ